MPELPEVETTKKSLHPLLGKKVTNVTVFQPKLRWSIPDDLDKLEGYRLDNISRRAKYLILSFSLDKSSSLGNSISLDKLSDRKSADLKRPPTLSVIIHLGMSGSLQQYPTNSEKRQHDHAIIKFADTDNFVDADNFVNTDNHDKGSVNQLHYHDPRRFGAILWHHEYAHRLFDHLGAEPLDETFTGDYLYNKIHRIATNDCLDYSKATRAKKPITRPIKSVIMDQTFVVGVGNIYATESLFLAGIHPNTPANTLSAQQINLLTDHIKSILARAIEQGGSTLRDFTVASGTTGYFQQTLHVYGKYKAPCPICETPIDKITINGRASTFCPTCQKNE